MPEKLVALYEYVKTLVGEYLVHAVLNLQFVDVIDILLLAAIIFYVYKFIRERRAARLARGLVFVVGVMIFSMLLNMRALKYILENFYQVGMIAIIVIFQSDLRSALEKFGSTDMKKLWNISANEYKAIVDMADTVSEAADAMARTHTGAIIAVERSTKLGEYLGQGVILNAEMSSPLLRNIFVNKAPLHDGAVIVRDWRVYAAGCYLPLSQADINKDLGTRHRAAIGLSEVSDAIVIVVSEETGTISLAVGGDLRRNYNYSSLKQALIKYLIPAESAEVGGSKWKFWKKRNAGGEKSSQGRNE